MEMNHLPNCGCSVGFWDPICLKANEKNRNIRIEISLNFFKEILSKGVFAEKGDTVEIKADNLNIIFKIKKDTDELKGRNINNNVTTKEKSE